MFDDLDDVADVDGESIGVNIVLHDDTVIRGFLQ